MSALLSYILAQIPMGGTDCAQPMIYAQRKKLEVDVFIVYTDSETWAGESTRGMGTVVHVGFYMYLRCS